MVIPGRQIVHNGFSWELRCPSAGDAAELSDLRAQIDSETEWLDREPGEAFLTPADFEDLIRRDAGAERNLFLVAKAVGRLVGFSRLEGNTLRRFRHKAEFGICILEAYWGRGIGGAMLQAMLQWADVSGIAKTELRVVQANEKAIRLYENHGFVQEGLLVNDRIYADGRCYNTVLMGRMANANLF